MTAKKIATFKVIKQQAQKDQSQDPCALLQDKSHIIVKIGQARGSNLHECLTSSNKHLLLELSKVYRNRIFVTRGNFVIAQMTTEVGKINGEIVRILTNDDISIIKSNNLWPVEFYSEKENVASSDEENDESLFVNNNRVCEDDYESDE